MNYAVTYYQALDEVPWLWRQDKPRKFQKGKYLGKFRARCYNLVKIKFQSSTK